MLLTSSQKKHLKALAHKLKPVILVGGNGVTEPVLAEIDNALKAHELIKIKVNLKERELCLQQIERICTQTTAEQIQIIGHTVVLYRQAKKPKIVLPA